MKLYSLRRGFLHRVHCRRLSPLSTRMRSLRRELLFGRCATETSSWIRPLVLQRGGSCVGGPRLARENAACRTEVACSHVSGLFTQSGGTAGPDGVREPSPHHSNGIDVPMKRQVWLGCVGSTDCAITRHCSLASSRTWLSGLSRRGHALVVLMPVHHRPGDARGLVG